LQEDVNSIPIQDGESIIYVAFPDLRLARCGLVVGYEYHTVRV